MTRHRKPKTAITVQSARSQRAIPTLRTQAHPPTTTVKWNIVRTRLEGIKSWLAVVSFKQMRLQRNFICSGWLNASNFTRQTTPEWRRSIANKTHTHKHTQTTTKRRSSALVLMCGMRRVLESGDERSCLDGVFTWTWNKGSGPVAWL